MVASADGYTITPGKAGSDRKRKRANGRMMVLIALSAGGVLLRFAPALIV